MKPQHLCGEEEEEEKSEVSLRDLAHGLGCCSPRPVLVPQEQKIPQEAGEGPRVTVLSPCHRCWTAGMGLSHSVEALGAAPSWAAPGLGDAEIGGDPSGDVPSSPRVPLCPGMSQ